MKSTIRKYAPPIFHCINDFGQGSLAALIPFFIIVFRLVRDVVANHKTTRYAGAATKVIQKNHLA